MILNTKLINEEVLTTETEATDFSFDESSKALMFKLFSKNIYSNPIGSIVREITSNCFDSHKEANVKKDVVIRINEPNKMDSTTGSISFIDFGVGLSPERVKSVYSKYFSSTKRDDNTQHGGFGIGSKVPFSYTRTFYVTTINNGIKYQYLMLMGEQYPQINLVHSEPTTEGNGTEICIPFMQKDDKLTFIEELENQLAYFDNITYENCGIDNSYKIHEGKTFLYKANAPYSRVHVVLGKVAYPLDFRTLGLSEYHYSCPIAVKIDIGEISVSMSRESLDYSPESIKIIKNKLNNFIIELTDLKNKENKDIKDFDTYLTKRYDSNSIMIDGSKVVLPSACDKSNPIKFDALNKLGIKIPHNIIFGYEEKFFSATKKKRRKGNDFPNVFSQIKFYIKDCDLKKNVISYLKETKGEFFLIDKRQIGFNLINEMLFGYSKSDTSSLEVQKTYEEYSQFIETYLETKCEKLSDVVIPQSWIDKNKKTRTKIDKEKGTIRFVDVNNIFDVNLTAKEIEDLNLPIIYGTREEKQSLISISNFLTAFDKRKGKYDSVNYIHRKTSLPIVIINKSSEKFFQGYEKAIHINDVAEKMGCEFIEPITKSIIGMNLSRVDMNFKNLLGETLFPKEIEIYENLVTKSAKFGIPSYTPIVEFVKTKNKAEIEKVMKEIELVQKASEMFDKETAFFNYRYFNSEEFVALYGETIKNIIASKWQ